MTPTQTTCDLCESEAEERRVVGVDHRNCLGGDECPQCGARWPEALTPLQGSDLQMFGYTARLTIELRDGEHDISHLLRADIGSGWFISADSVVREIAIKERARERAMHLQGSSGIAERSLRCTRCGVPMLRPPGDGSVTVLGETWCSRCVEHLERSA